MKRKSIQGRKGGYKLVRNEFVRIRRKEKYYEK